MSKSRIAKKSIYTRIKKNSSTHMKIFIHTCQDPELQHRPNFEKAQTTDENPTNPDDSKNDFLEKIIMPMFGAFFTIPANECRFICLYVHAYAYLYMHINVCMYIHIYIYIYISR